METVRWYVAHTHPSSEKKALINLSRQGFTAFLPQYRKQRRHARRIESVRAPLFPRYIFVAMDVTRERWRAVSSTFGVNHLVCQGDLPTPVPHGIVEDLQARIDDNGLVPLEPRVPYRPGESVQVISGVLTDRIGLFDGVTDEQRVILLLDLLGRQVRVKLPLEATAPAA